jgi:hypothetical protein
VTLGTRELAVIAATLAALVALHPRPHTQAPQAPVRASNLVLNQTQRAGTLKFVPGTNPVDVAAVRTAIEGARPEARRLIDLVDGVVTVHVAPTGDEGVAGVTETSPNGLSMTLDLGTISRWLGTRGISRLVLHEFGHVVDFVLVPPELRARLDAAIPPGYPCSTVDDGTCAGRSAREERFAETFAKWAMNDIGINLEIGYRVPPPRSLSEWGLLLAALR